MDAVKIAVAAGGLALLISTACGLFVLRHNLDSRNIALGIGTFIAAGVFLCTQVLYELKPKTENHSLGLTYSLDRANSTVNLTGTSLVGGAEVGFREIVRQDVNRHLLQTPALLTGDRDQLFDQLTVYNLVSFLATSQIDWQLEMHPFGNGTPSTGYTFKRVSQGEECTLVTSSELQTQLKATGNPFASLGVRVFGDDLCLPPNTHFELDADGVRLINPFCDIRVTRSRGPMLYVDPSTRSRVDLPSGESRYEERPMGLLVSVKWSPWRAQNPELPKYRVWLQRTIVGLRAWFEGKAPTA